MARILVAMPEKTFERMHIRDFVADLNSLGDVRYCLNPRDLSEEEYAALWRDTEAVVTGWGVRPPTPAVLDVATDLRIISHTAGSIRMFPRYALERGIAITSARAA